jgi:putative CocE/NonD family hydrolase
MVTQVVVESNVPVLMRDRTVLYADVYRPASPGRYPVLVQRTPYDKGQASVTGIDYLRAARAGYVVVVQDVRGRFASQGEFYPFLHEAADGYDTVEWAAAQAWSSGRVGMVGGSYLGATQWLAAMARPPHLQALFPAITPSDMQDGWVFQGGAFQLGFCLSWTLSPLVLANWDAIAASRPGIRERRDGIARTIDHMGEEFRRLPLTEFPDLDNGVAPYYFDWMEHADDEEYWDRWNIEAHHAEISVPAYHVGGWYDLFLPGTLRNFGGLRDRSTGTQKLLVGPWAHASPLSNLVGEVDFGIGSAASAIDLDGIQLRWFDHWLKGERNGILEESPLRIFVMGENRWRDEHEWPLARAREVSYYLHSNGDANSAAGDGSLDPEAPGAEPTDTFRYDPLEPVPTRGGGLCCNPTYLPGGVYDQRPVEARHDVLVYTSAPLAREMEVTGPVRVHLWAATSAPDTDFTAKLVDVHPDGSAYNLADGIIRTRYRESRAVPSPLQPGKAVALSIDLGATSNLFKAGHRIRLEVSSSNFPRFNRNPNTGAPLASGSEMIAATQTVLHNESHASRVILPTIHRDWR